MPKPWTAPEEARLRADYPHHTNRKLAEMYGRTMASIHHRAALLRLAKSPDLTWPAWNRKSGWRPIETAPKDAVILLRVDGVAREGQWMVGGWGVKDLDMRVWWVTPDNWAILPEPPK